MTLPTSAAERRGVAPLRRLLSIDMSCPRGTQQQTRHIPSLLLIDGTDRRMEGRSTIS